MIRERIYSVLVDITSKKKVKDVPALFAKNAVIESVRRRSGQKVIVFRVSRTLFYVRATAKRCAFCRVATGSSDLPSRRQVMVICVVSVRHGQVMGKFWMFFCVLANGRFLSNHFKWLARCFSLWYSVVYYLYIAKHGMEG